MLFGILGLLVCVVALIGLLVVCVVRGLWIVLMRRLGRICRWTPVILSR
mgnify:CR=1 FL=1